MKSKIMTLDTENNWLREKAACHSPILNKEKAMLLNEILLAHN